MLEKKNMYQTDVIRMEMTEATLSAKMPTPGGNDTCSKICPRPTLLPYPNPYPYPKSRPALPPGLHPH